MRTIKSVWLTVAKIVKGIFGGCVTIVGGIIIIGWFLGFVALVLFSLIGWLNNRVDVSSPDCQNLARSVLEECGIGAGRLKKVHHKYKSMPSFHGDHAGAYAIEVSYVDVAMLTPENGWTRTDRASGGLEGTPWSLPQLGSYVGWLPSERELKARDIFVYSLPWHTFSVVLVRLSDNMVFYIYVQT